MERTSIQVPVPISRTRAAFRWIAVVPGAALCIVLAHVLVGWIVAALQAGSGYPGKSDPNEATIFAVFASGVLEQLCMAFLAPLIAISVGARIAPRFKFQAGITLAVLLGILYGYGGTIVAGEVADGLYTAGSWIRLGHLPYLPLLELPLGFTARTT